MTDHRDRELVSYLLGTLPQDRADAFDELSVTDDAFAAQLRVAEDDLIDAFVCGELTGETLAQFETAYLSSPRRRERVTFARELRRAARSKRDAPPPAMPEPIVPPPPVVTPAARPVAMAMRALVPALLAIVCIALVVDRVRMQGELDRVRSEITELASQFADLLRLHNGMTGSNSPAPGSPALLALRPSSAANLDIARLDLDPAAVDSAFDLLLASNPFPAYQAELTDVLTSERIWQSDWIAATTAAPPVVALRVPARMLKPGFYSFVLVGRGASGASEPVAIYKFVRSAR